MNGSGRLGARKKFPWRSYAAFCLLVAVSSCFSACAGSQSLDQRGEAVRLYHYQGLRDELIVEHPRLSVTTARPGDTITREVTFALLAPQREKKFQVSEVVTLTGPGLTVELSKQEGEKSQGSHISTLLVTVPKDLPPGVYTLITKIATEEHQVTQKTAFQVVK